MRISSIGYCIKQGLKNIWRNKMFSLASVATMSACIFLFGIFFCVVENFQYMVKEAEKSVAVTVFFDEGISQEDMDAIGEKIRGRDEVSDVVFVSAEESWEQYKEIYFKDNPQLAEGFADDNPLANQAHYEIYLKDVAEQENLVDWLGSVSGIRKINQSAQVADILTNFNMLIGYISIAVIILLLCVSVFLISNTVTIGIAVRREEIGIMKLIGATNGFVKAPFVVEGILIGLVGASVPLALLYYLYTRLIGFVGDKFNALTGLLHFLPVGQMFRILLPVGMALGVGIGFFGSFFTIRKHLKV
ncbi:ABC transporter permease [Anaerosacchariphilus sp. NSJ-68]|uniref:Cell division protein FtsX n=2 Tax=Lachnospiraceae TaxID=186803 RepID=A0A923RMK8_9FIRM|nr:MULTISPECIES: permease-like cell division protein FtsX [Lachnospiraceae]MBC5658510.1 ABC transporter permease [Anaerosacchariphilus hominis]MBC5698281.1 ABC transporter permease [Roseburia difficilis]